MRRRAAYDAPSAARAARTRAALEQDRLPPDLVTRLQRGGAASSALSVADAATLGRLGGRPLALVSGASVLRPLHQPMPSPTPRRAPAQGSVRELEVRSGSWNTARGRSLRRLTEEARLAGADLVIGVRLRRAERRHEDPDVGHLVEVVATGTAVRLPGTGGPALTTLGAAELDVLGRAGWQAAGVVAATTVCYVVSGRATIDRVGLTWAQGGTNSEVEDYTRGLYAARSRAIGRVEAAAKRAGAAGIVGLAWEQEVTPVRREGFGTRDLEVTLHVSATAIRPSRPTAGALPATAVELG